MSSLTSPGLKAMADKALVQIQSYLEKINGVALDCTDEFLIKTNTVAVPVIAGAAETFNAQSANYAHTTGTLSFVDVQCTTHKKATFSLTDIDCLQIEDAPMWSKFAKASADKIGASIVTDVMSLLTYTSRESSATCATITLSSVAALAAEAMDAGYDPMQCTLYLAPTQFFQLVSLLPSGVVGDGNIIKSARIDGAMFGFGSVQASPNIAIASGASANNGIGFIVPNGAIALATRIPKQPKGGCIEIGTQTDEPTGFTFGVRVHTNNDIGETFLNVESLYGAALTKSNSNGAPGYIQVVSA